MSGTVAGLNFTAVRARLKSHGLRGEDRGRAIELLAGLEIGVMKGLARASEDEEER